MILYIINSVDSLYCINQRGMVNILCSCTDCDIFRKYKHEYGSLFEYLKGLDDERVRLIRSDVIRITDVGISEVDLRDINADLNIPIISRQQCEKINGYDVSFYYLRTYIKRHYKPHFPNSEIIGFFRDRFKEQDSTEIILICRDEHLKIGEDYDEYKRYYKDDDGETQYISKRYKKSANRIHESSDGLNKLNINRNIKTDLFDIIDELSPLSDLIIQAGN